jgi:hypothetical protein
MATGRQPCPSLVVRNAIPTLFWVPNIARGRNVKNEIGRRSTTFLLIGILVPSTFVLAQQSRWASRDDPVAKKMIQDEKDWAEGGCTQTSVGETFLADDFQGTAPSGERYNKSDALKRDASLKERDCHLDDAKVRFFGESMAVIYGSERALRVGKDGKESMRCLVWTDTWIKRDSKWEIIAAQDTSVPCK